MKPKVSIIILNWNGWKDTIECLESLYQITYPNYDVILVDNGSEDESIEKIKEYCDGKIKVESKFFKYDPNNKPIKIIEYAREEAEAGGRKEKKITDSPSNRKLTIIKNEKNYGFAEGNNIALRYSFKDSSIRYIVTLNNDVIVDSNWLNEMMIIAERDNKIGSVMPKVLHYDSPHLINTTGILITGDGSGANRGFLEKDNENFSIIEEIFGPSAVSTLYRKKTLENIKVRGWYFDPDYFVYNEDTDLAYRMMLCGWKSIFTPRAITYHKHSATSGTYSAFKSYYSQRNRWWTSFKNYPFSYVIYSYFYYVVKMVLIFRAYKKGEGRAPIFVKKLSFKKIIYILLKSFFDAHKELPALIKKRREIQGKKVINKKTMKDIFKKYSIKISEIPYK